MTPERWQQLKGLFQAALERAPEERPAFLDAACAGDGELRAAVGRLLSADERNGSFLDSPAVDRSAPMPPETEGESLVGSTFGHYHVLQALGSGGMGEVYLAEDDRLDRKVALKLLPDIFASDEKRVRRFAQEARAASALNHPNICVIYEVNETPQGRHYIAMEYIDGVTLRQRMAGAPLAVPEALEIALQIAAALAAAHAAGVVHRDIKPENIMLRPDGFIKVLDFGLAKLIEKEISGARPEAPTKALFNTDPGLVMGTVSYMSPEQMRGQAVDARTDLWSLGVVLYEMIAGRAPFEGATNSDVIAAVIGQDPPPLAHYSEKVPAALEASVKKALMKKREERYQTATEIQGDLRRIKQRLDVAAELERSAPPKEDDSGKTAKSAAPRLQKASGEEIPPGRGTQAIRRQTAEEVRQKWSRRTAVAALALLVVLACSLIGRLYMTGRLSRAVTKEGTSLPAGPADVKPRRTIALLGFKNLSGREGMAWLSPAFTEMLATELAAGEKLRVIPEENVARMKLELQLKETDSLAPDSLARIRANINADLVVLGSYIALGGESGGRIRLDLRLQDADSGEIVASLAEAGTEEQIFDMVTRIGARLRESLGIGALSLSEAGALRASLPANPESARLYAEGRERLGVFDALAARDLLERAIATDSAFPLAYSSLAAAWTILGYDVKARETAQKAFELSSSLRREEQLAVEGRYRETEKQWDGAVKIYRTLFDFFPDNPEYGLRLAAAQTNAGQAPDALATVAALRKLPAPISDDPRIDMAESGVADSLSDYKREQATAEQAAAKGAARNAWLIVAEAYYYKGWALWNLGEADKANSAYEEAKRLYAAAGQRKGVADILNAIATIHWSQSDYDAALRIYEEALAIKRDLGQKEGVAAILNNIANVLKDEGDLTSARSRYEESLALHRETGAKNNLPGSLLNLANVIKAQGDLPAAKKLYEESIAIARSLGRKSSLTEALNEYGELFYFQGDLTTAKRLNEEALALAREAGRRSSYAYALLALGQIAAAEDDLTGARKLYEESLSVRDELGEKGTASESRCALAQLALEENHPADANQLAQDAREEFAKQKSSDDEALADAILAESHLAKGELDAAQTAIAHATELASKTENRAVRILVAIREARVSAESGRVAEAQKLLESQITEATKIGLINLSLEARLALGEVLMKHGEEGHARAQLGRLAREARAKGFELIGRKAANAISG